VSAETPLFEPEEFEPSQFAFIREHDPNLYHWLVNAPESDDLRMALCCGALGLIHELREWDREAKGTLSLNRALNQWLFVNARMHRLRDAMRLLRLIARERENNIEIEELRDPQEGENNGSAQS
jgi:hypothetical protein